MITTATKIIWLLYIKRTKMRKDRNPQARTQCPTLIILKQKQNKQKNNGKYYFTEFIYITNVQMQIQYKLIT